jgi:hypothetical protein
VKGQPMDCEKIFSNWISVTGLRYKIKYIRKSSNSIAKKKKNLIKNCTGQQPVAQVYNSIFLGGWTLGDQGLIPAALAKKVSKTPSQPIAGHGGVYLSSQAMWEGEMGRIMVPGQPGK